MDYQGLLSKLEGQYDLPHGLLGAVMQAESSGNPQAVSPKGAQGLFQFMPATAQGLGINPHDPVQAAQGAAKYLAQLKSQTGDIGRALVSWNWGIGNLMKKGLHAAPMESLNFANKVLGALNPVGTAQADELPPAADKAMLPPAPQAAELPAAPAADANAPMAAPSAEDPLAPLRARAMQADAHTAEDPLAPLRARAQGKAAPLRIDITVPAHGGYQNAYQQQMIDQMPWYQRLAVGAGKGAMDVVHGAAQLGLEGAHGLGLVGNDTLQRFNASVQNDNAAYQPLGEQSTAADIGQFLGTTGALLPAGIASDAAAVAALPSRLGRLGVLSARGAASGGITGALPYAGPEDSRATNIGIGALLGGALPGAAALAKRAVVAPVQAALSPFTDSGRNAAVGNLLRDVATQPDAPVQAAPLSGMPLTLGQATNDPGILALERTVQMSSPETQGMFQGARTQQNQAVRDALQGLSQPHVLPEEASTALRGHLDDALGQARAQENALWQAIDPTGQATVPTDTLKQEVDQYVQGLSKTRRQFLPQNLLDIVQGFRPQEPLQEHLDLNSALGAEIRKLHAGGDYNAANAVSGLKGVVQQHIDNLPISDPAVAQRYQQARAFSRDLNQAFTQNPLGRILGTDGSGAERVNPSQTAAQLIQPGQPEKLDALLQAVGKNPDALQAARTYFINSIMPKIQMAGTDGQGDNLINGARLQKTLYAYHSTLPKLFSPAQQQMLRAIEDSAAMAERTARAGLPGGSDTYAKLAGQSFMDHIVGKWLGHSTGLGLPLKMVQMLYAAPQERINALVRDAILDPKLGKQLMLKATPGNANLLSPRLLPYLDTAASAGTHQALSAP